MKLSVRRIIPWLCLCLLIASQARAEQTQLPTVQESLFRSRWINPQVDQAPPPEPPSPLEQPIPEVDEGKVRGFLHKFQKSIHRNAFDLSMGVSFGWEYSNQQNNQGTSTTTSPTPTPTPIPVATPVPSPSPSPKPSPNPSPGPIASPTPAVAATPTPTPAATPKPSPTPTPKKAATSTAFVAPWAVMNYQKQTGPWDLALRYSVGYIYYFEKDYAPVNSELTPLSQSASATVQYVNGRFNLRSVTGGSAGAGTDIETGSQTDRTSLSESLISEYQLQEYLYGGAQLTLSKSFYSQGTNSQQNDNGASSAALYTRYAFSGKTALQLEWSTGTTSQSSGGTSYDRTYSQLMAIAIWTPSEKTRVELGLGPGMLDDGLQSGGSNQGMRPVYRLNSRWSPTDKVNLQLSIAREGATNQPTYRLSAGWNPRDRTAFQLGVYQSSSYSSSRANQDYVSRGINAQVTQSLFARVSTRLSGGWEQSTYAQSGGTAQFQNNKPYYYVLGFLGYQMNEWAAWQLAAQISSGKYGNVQGSEDIETRVSVSFALTL